MSDTLREKKNLSEKIWQIRRSEQAKICNRGQLLFHHWELSIWCCRGSNLHHKYQMVIHAPNHILTP